MQPFVHDQFPNGTEGQDNKKAVGSIMSLLTADG
jgi:hypothetical protein